MCFFVCNCKRHFVKRFSTIKSPKLHISSAFSYRNSKAIYLNVKSKKNLQRAEPSFMTSNDNWTVKTYKYICMLCTYIHTLFGHSSTCKIFNQQICNSIFWTAMSSEIRTERLRLRVKLKCLIICTYKLQGTYLIAKMSPFKSRQSTVKRIIPLCTDKYFSFEFFK